MWEWIKKQIIFICVKKGQWLYIWIQCSLLIAVIQDEGHVTTIIVVCVQKKKEISEHNFQQISNL